ncbi:TolC family protein [Maribellus sp. CM-23]|uniref:TolC family protein n=1 Tax=Maribellus sp. CM-23 TaxID=2781026 RepID=UPI001F4312EE|nr:TolC family protein [Maribellus sp. CM-23]
MRLKLPFRILNNRSGKRKICIEVAKAQQAAALANFSSTLLNAGKEVNNALSLYDASVQKSELRQKQLEALEKSVDYTKEQLNYGSATYTEVLNAQLSNVNEHIQQPTAVVNLYSCIGRRVEITDNFCLGIPPLKNEVFLLLVLHQQRCFTKNRKTSVLF